MSDLDNQPQDLNNTIKEGLKVLEKSELKDQSLWKTFREKFEGDTKDNFKLATLYYLQKLENFLQKYSVWVQKRLSIAIARAFYNTFQEEKFLLQTEAKVKFSIANDKKFDFGHIRWLFTTDFGQKL